MSDLPYLVEHNDKVFKERFGTAEKAGVLCSFCAVEMVYKYENRINATMPPSKTVICPKCGWEGKKYE